jgi:hypothetical protein
MNTAKQLLGDLQQLVKRWEQQIFKHEERTTAPAAKANGDEKRAAEVRPTVSAEAKSSKPGINLSK